ncbi:BspA family leucine-rich repeat surface protein [Butyrivibrio sp. AD3002]|uniref:BspA family leucine-rich repeat surface protein n=1 Tax=Butyrivibrio sp. AD3002 TaxID=1280670 RepID=UPI0003B4AE88|nr:BspA family leucine-rich repeat surface protein [Butyrivibrio sp. AD3002]
MLSCLNLKKSFLCILIPIYILCTVSVSVLAASSVSANTDNTKNKYYEAKNNAGIAKYWKYWSQGASQYPKVRSDGCRMVAYSKMLVDIGVENNPDVFNPDRFYEWCKSNSYISGTIGDNNISEIKGTNSLAHMTTGACAISYASSKGVTIYGKKWPIYPNSAENQEQILNQMMSLLKHGCYLVLGSDPHYTYIDRDASLANNEIYIDDSIKSYSYDTHQLVKLKDCTSSNSYHLPFSNMQNLLAFSTTEISDEWLNDGGGEGGSYSGGNDPSYDHNEYINAGYEYADTQWYKHYDYTLDSSAKTITITKYKGSSPKIVIGHMATINGNNYKTVIGKNGSSYDSHFYIPNCVNTVMFEKGVIFPEDSSYLFFELGKVKRIYARFVDTSNVTKMKSMFTRNQELEILDIANWDTSKVADMSFMFSACTKLTSLDVSRFNTKNVQTLQMCFNQCFLLSSLDVSKWNTSNVKDLNGTFVACKSLSSLNLSKWDTSNVINMSSTFGSCNGLKSLNVSGWNTSSVNNMANMFSNCTSLESLDIRNFDMNNIQSKGNGNSSGGIGYMLAWGNTLKSLYLPHSFPSIEYGDAFAGSYDELFDNNGIYYSGTISEWKSLNHIVNNYVKVKVVCTDGTFTNNSTSSNTNDSNNTDENSKENNNSSSKIPSQSNETEQSEDNNIDNSQKTTKLSKLSSGKKSIQVKWKKRSGDIKGYEIQYSTDKRFKNAKSLTITKTKTTSKVIKKLKPQKKYYVRIRTYKKAGGKKVYSKWSKALSIKTK